MPILPPPFLDCVVAMGFKGSEDKIRYLATGFLVGRFLKAAEDGRRLYEIFLVTNKHVLEGETQTTLRFNPNGEEPAREFTIDLVDAEGTPVWLGHPDAQTDVGVLGINARRLDEEGIRFSFFKTDSEVPDRLQATRLGFCEGDGVFVLGFPLGLVGEHRNYVVVRQGAIARIRDALAGATKEFLVDATVFPGNSGGPVVSRPEPVLDPSGGPRARSYLLGLVASYVPYRDVAISQQTKRTRVVFEENSGLTAILPSEFILQAVEEASAALGEMRRAEDVAAGDGRAEPAVLTDRVREDR